MAEGNNQQIDVVEVVEYDPRWPKAYMLERDRLLKATGNIFDTFEHIGSTSVPGLAAKPIIDMMSALADLQEADALLPTLEDLGYGLIETGMRNRLFLQRRAADGLRYNLHIVETATWDDRNERHLRDYLIANPGEADAYGALKIQLAYDFRDNGQAYTRAKTAFVQKAIDAIRDAKGLPRIDVWED